MSYCRSEGKDKIMFLTKEELDQPSKITLPEDEEQPGLILPSGEINWACPCLGGMATGPCGVEFREAFSCFHYSSANPKGSDCYDMFKSMQECMSQYPVLYSKSEENNDNGDDDDEEEGDDEDDENVNVSLPQTPVELHDREEKIMTTSVEDNTSTLSDKHS